MSIKNVSVLLDRFWADAVVVEVTHRSARRLFGLRGLEPVLEVVRPPRRPEPGRGCGRLSILPETPDPEPLAAPPPVKRFEQPAIDYSALDAAMALADQTIRRTRHSLAIVRMKVGYHSADQADAALSLPGSNA